MSSSSSSSPQPPPGPGGPPGDNPPPPGNGGPPPPLPPNSSGSPPPPPPSSSSANTSSVTSANYFFGFVITFVVLLLLFVGCGIGSWRRFRLIGTAWDERLQDMEGASFATPRKRGRRRLVRPMFAETWTDPTAPMQLVPGAVTDKEKWEGVQPISAALIWSRLTLSTWAHRVNAAATSSTPSGRGGSGGVMATLRSFVLPRRPRCNHPPRPPPGVTRPPPEAIQVAVMISMPSPPLSPTPRLALDEPRYVGQPGVVEYQIGVVQIPWPSGEGP